MYPEIMADMFEAMTELPSSKRQRFNWEKVTDKYHKIIQLDSNLY